MNNHRTQVLLTSIYNARSIRSAPCNISVQLQEDNILDLSNFNGKLTEIAFSELIKSKLFYKVISRELKDGSIIKCCNRQLPLIDHLHILIEPFTKIQTPLSCMPFLTLEGNNHATTQAVESILNNSINLQGLTLLKTTLSENAIKSLITHRIRYLDLKNISFDLRHQDLLLSVLRKNNIKRLSIHIETQQFANFTKTINFYLANLRKYHSIQLRALELDLNCYNDLKIEPILNLKSLKTLAIIHGYKHSTEKINNLILELRQRRPQLNVVNIYKVRTNRDIQKTTLQVPTTQSYVKQDLLRKYGSHSTKRHLQYNVQHS